jgi:hypothetical protein
VDHVEYPHKDNATNSGHQDLCNPTCGLDADQASEESADYTAKQPDDEIAKQAKTGAAYEQPANQPAIIPLIIHIIIAINYLLLSALRIETHHFSLGY